jgi:hypothetical protein
MGLKLAVSWLAAVAAIFSFAIAPVRADEPLRWKFQPGQQLRYSVIQAMTISGGADADSASQNTTRQQIDMTWQVKSVADSGDAVIELSFDRIRSKMTLPTGGLEYDSDASGPPSGMAAINAPLYGALVRSPVEIKMSPLGRLLEVKLPEAVPAALRRMPTAAIIGDLTKPETFQNQFLNGFPQATRRESLESGETWSTESTAQVAGLGSLAVVTNYRYEGLRDGDGARYAVIRPTRTVSISAAEGSERTIKDQSSTGEILFDPSGRLHRSTLKHRLTMAVTIRGREVEQTMELSIEVNPLPQQ